MRARAICLLAALSASIQAGASEASKALDEVLDGLAKGASAPTASRAVTRSSTELEKQAIITKANGDMLPAFQGATRRAEQRDAELRTEPSPITSLDAAADRAMRLAAVQAETERRRNEWFYSGLTIAGIAVAFLILFIELRARTKRKARPSA